ncbi:MAG: uroporphyrinogen decarboxylase family protein [Christensenellales bacterium]|jgi:uroporphyrinogen decarboxylase
MKVQEILRNACAERPRRALPVLSFPAAQKLHVTVRDIVSSAEAQARAMEYIAKNTDTIAAVGPMDLSVEAESFGASIRFSEDEIPTVIGALLKDADDCDRLQIPKADAARCGLYAEAVRLAKARIADKPVLAGMIGPFSLAGRLMDVSEIMILCLEEPETVEIVLEKVTSFLCAYARALREAGADGIVMAEPLAGIISPKMMREFSVPYVKKIIDSVQEGDFGVIYHNCGNAVMRMLPDIFGQGAIAYHFGNAVDMADVLKQAPKDAICLGNIDPALHFAGGTPEEMRRAVRALLQSCKGAENLILSSGCDIPHTASWENIDAFFEAVAMG